ncbi:MAG: hypothetical protein ACOC5T_07245 [Elusimicrobiota bacterium]
MGIGNLPSFGGDLEIVRDDVEHIIRLNGITAVLIRESKTYGNSGEIIETNEKRYNIYVKIVNETRENRQFLNQGKEKTGEITGYFWREYPNDITRNGDLIVQTGDKIKDQNGVYWRVEEMNIIEYEGKEAFRKGKLRRI